MAAFTESQLNRTSGGQLAQLSGSSSPLRQPRAWGNDFVWLHLFFVFQRTGLWEINIQWYQKCWWKQGLNTPDEEFRSFLSLTAICCLLQTLILWVQLPFLTVARSKVGDSIYGRMPSSRYYLIKIIVLRVVKILTESTEQPKMTDTYTTFTAGMWTQGPFEAWTIQLAN